MFATGNKFHRGEKYVARSCLICTTLRVLLG